MSNILAAGLTFILGHADVEGATKPLIYESILKYNGDVLPHSKLNKMKRQRKMQQMKKCGKNPQDQRNEEEIGSLSEKDFRVIIVMMVLRKKMQNRWMHK